MFTLLYGKGTGYNKIRPRTSYEKSGYNFTAYDISRTGFRVAALEKQL